MTGRLQEEVKDSQRWPFFISSSMSNPKLGTQPTHSVEQWSSTLGLQMFLDFNSQKSWPADVVVKASGSCSPNTSGGPRLGTIAVEYSTGDNFENTSDKAETLIIQ